MKVKELAEKLNKCIPEAEIGIAEYDTVVEIQGVGMTLYGKSSIMNMVYTLRATEELDEITEISGSLNEDIENNYITKLESENCELTELVKKLTTGLSQALQDDTEGLLSFVIPLETLDTLEKLEEITVTPTFAGEIEKVISVFECECGFKDLEEQFQYCPKCGKEIDWSLYEGAK